MILDPKELTPEVLEKLSDAVNKVENPTTYLGVDPGKSNGICGYDEKFYLQFMYTVPADMIVDFVNTFDKLKTVVIEDFKLYPNKSKHQVYSDMETSRVIGRFETLCALKKVTLIKQGASIKATGYKWIGEKPLPKSNKNNHVLDAHVHFMYWAVRTQRISAADLIKPRRPAQ